MKKILSILSLLSLACLARAYPLVMFNPTNGAVLNATNLSLTAVQSNQVSSLAAAAVSAATNSFDPLGAANSATNAGNLAFVTGASFSGTLQSLGWPFNGWQIQTNGNALFGGSLAPYAIGFNSASSNALLVTGNIAIRSGGEFLGNGSGITNLPYAALTGAPAIPSTNGLSGPSNNFTGTFSGTVAGNGAGLTLYPEADAFWTNGTVQTLYGRNRLEGMEAELKAGGMWTGFVDAAIESPRLFGSNSVTFFQRPMLISNIVVNPTGWGATYNGYPTLGNTNSSIRIYGLGGNGLLTNTIVFVYKENITNAGLANGAFFGAGLFDTNSNSGDYVVAGWNAGLNPTWEIEQRATNLWTYNVTNYILGLVNGSATSYQAPTVYGLNRSVMSLVNDGHGNQSVWYNGLQWWLNYNTPARVQAALYTNTADLNCLCIGSDITNGYSSSYVSFCGQIQAVLVFNFAITNTAQAACIQRAAQWLDPATSIEFVFGDSRSAPNLSYGLNWWPLLESLSEPNVCVYNLAWNGTKFADLNTASSSATNYIIPACVPSFITPVIIKNAIGINDYYANGMTGPQYNTFHTNFAAFFHGMGYQYWPCTVFGVATNCSGLADAAPYYWTNTVESNILTGNVLVISNGWMFDDMPRFDFRVTTTMLNSNQAQIYPALGEWSISGLHFNGPNGGSGQMILANEARKPSHTVTTNYADWFAPLIQW